MDYILQQLGYPGIFLTIIGEIGFMLFPLPGDTLLFAAGMYAQMGKLDYEILLITVVVASTISGHMGYFIGSKLDKETLLNNRFFKIKDSHLHKTEKFFEKYGIYAIIFSRFAPIVRNFISQLMGMINYDKRKFFWANLTASIIWPLVLINVGRAFGEMFPDLINYAEYFMVAILGLLFIPILYELWKSRKNKKHS